jgi:hypothetical protein
MVKYVRTPSGGVDFRRHTCSDGLFEPDLEWRRHTDKPGHRLWAWTGESRLGRELSIARRIQNRLLNYAIVLEAECYLLDRKPTPSLILRQGF